jgi:Fur family transcriptional regulator, ferric uptake regulator
LAIRSVFLAYISHFTPSTQMKAKQPTRAENRSARRSDPTPSLAENRLRAATVRVTAARVQVLSALLVARSAMSHQDMQDSLSDMDRVTLYRALDCLTAAGLAHTIAGDDRIFRYSVSNDHATDQPDTGAAEAGHHSPHQHSHFKCTRCAKVFCLADTVQGKAPGATASQAALRQFTLRRQLQSALQETLGTGFQSHDIELTIKGWCADCSH